MYAVTGATGQLGRLVIASLLERASAADIVALVRDPSRAADLAERGVEVRPFDYDAPDRLAAPLADVKRLLFISSDDVARRIEQHRAVINAAASISPELITYTSIIHADTNPISLAESHRQTERMIAAAGLSYAILRNSWYIENYTDRISQFVAQGEIIGAAGDTPFAGATRADYADAATTVLLHDGHTGATYELGGTPFTMTDLAAAITDASGTRVTYRNVSSAELLTALQSAGIPDGYAQVLVALDEATARGELDTDSGDLQRLLGRPTTPLADVVKRAL